MLFDFVTLASFVKKKYLCIPYHRFLKKTKKKYCNYFILLNILQ